MYRRIGCSGYFILISLTKIFINILLTNIINNVSIALNGNKIGATINDIIQKSQYLIVLFGFILANGFIAGIKMKIIY